MIHEIFDFFPFNMESGPEFLMFYLLLTLAVLTAASVLRAAISARLDRAFLASKSKEEPIVSSDEGGTPYRRPGRPPRLPRQKLTVGWIPKPDEHCAIAYLQGGTRGVANTLISTAMAAEWLRFSKKNPANIRFKAEDPPRIARSPCFTSCSWIRTRPSCPSTRSRRPRPWPRSSWSPR